MARVADIVDERFTEDVSLIIPPSLSYGGKTTGNDAIKKLLRGISHPKSPVDIATLTIERIAADRDQVAAQISFSWRIPAGEAIPTSVVEWFTFRDGKVAELTVFYFDTARWIAST